MTNQRTSSTRIPIYRQKGVLVILVLITTSAAWLASSDLHLPGSGVQPSDVAGEWCFDEVGYAKLTENLLGKAAGSGNPLQAYGVQLAGIRFDFAPDSYAVTRASSTRTVPCTYQVIAENTLLVQPAETATTPVAKPQGRAIPPGFSGSKEALDPSGRLTLVVDTANSRLMVRTAVFAFPFTRAP